MAGYRLKMTNLGSNIDKCGMTNLYSKVCHKAYHSQCKKWRLSFDLVSPASLLKKLGKNIH